MRSDQITKGIQRTPHRALLRATGKVTSGDFGKPLIAVVSSHVEIIPGHVHLDKVARIVSDAIRAAGGVPFICNTIGVCDGIAMGHGGMLYSLPSRELIADCVETMLGAHCFDGAVMIPNCDKIVPGMLMAALRTNVPTIVVSGGAMAAGRMADGSKSDLINAFSGVAAHGAGTMTTEQLQEIECKACPTPGSCSGMFTANSMNCLTEALGLGLPGNGTILAGRSVDELNPERIALWQTAGRRILEVVKQDLRPRSIVTMAALGNAMSLDVAMGGSSNTVLHLLAIAREAGLQYDIRRIDTISRRVPTLCKLSPNANWHIEDCHRAGGISAILGELAAAKLIDLTCSTVAGKLADILQGKHSLDHEVIHPITAPYSADGGLAILVGNLAPEGAVVKTAGVLADMLTFEGEAVCFDSQEEACAGILGGKVRPGHVVVIRYEGPKGGPGMQEMLAPTSYIKGAGLSGKVALITDGRFSGGTSGASIGHISPEAAAGGPLALVKNGDRIRYDIPKRELSVLIPDAELTSRKTAWKPIVKACPSSWLRRYRAMATSASTGAVLADPG